MNDALLEMCEVEIAHGGRLVVRAATFSVARHQWLALVGPNASGKTTLLRCAAGQLPPAHGVVRFAGRDLDAAGGNLPVLAVAPEELPPFLSLQQALEIQAAAHDLDEVPEATLGLCAELGLAAYRDALVGSLSLGTRQKLAVVLALLTDPPLLLLDEVFNGLDVRSALALKRHLRARVAAGAAIVLATHALDVVRDCCDGLVLVDGGSLVRAWNAAELRAFRDTAEMEQALAAALPVAGPV